jgi:hypothetical protein
MERFRYELDPYNRLVLYKGGGSGLPEFRQVLDGRFNVDKNNSLSYHVKAPLRETEKIPNQIKLRGEWSLTDSHDLRFTLDKQSRETFGDEVTLQGEILDVKANSLLFAVTTRKTAGARSTYVLNLAGSWKADENSRLSFRVKRQKGECDILTFSAAWEVDNNHAIVYRYEKSNLVTKKKKVHALAFKGRWDIKEAFRISYVLDGRTDSVFDFTTSAGVFKERYIKYEIGIGLAGRVRPKGRTITLFGKWNLKRDADLVFEVEYENGKAAAVTFGADAQLTDKDTVFFRLKDYIGNKDLGATLELSRRIFKGEGEAFLRALKKGGESAIYAGAAWRW